jgi:hypothetical protein
LCAGLALTLAASVAHAQQAATVEESYGVPHALHTSPIAPNAPVPPFDITAGQENLVVGTGNVTSTGANAPIRSFSASGGIVVRGGSEFLMRADSLNANVPAGTGNLTGDVYLHEIDTTITADSLAYDARTGIGIFDNAFINYPPFNISAHRLQVQAAVMKMTDVTMSTLAPSRHQAYHIHASTVELETLEHEALMRNVAFYLAGTRIATLKKYTFRQNTSIGATNPNQALHPTVAYDSQRGPYVVVGTNILRGSVPTSVDLLIPSRRGWSASASTSSTILLRRPTAAGAGSQIDKQTNEHSLVSVVRDAASYPGPPLPMGDALLYHDLMNNDPLESVFNRPITPDFVPYATIAYRQPVYGRSIGSLVYSRLPEGGFRFDLPVLGNGVLPTDRNPHEMRAALKKIYLYAVITGTQGYYEEQPTAAKSTRTALQINFDARPILVGRDTLFRPKFGFLDAHYGSGSVNYTYQQMDLALQRSFSDTNAIGCEYIATFQHGHDPFVFDSVDTSQEFDVRGQRGWRHLIVGARVKYDLIGLRVFDTQVSVGFPQKGLTPTLLFDHPSNSIGFNLSIPGLTY